MREKISDVFDLLRMYDESREGTEEEKWERLSRRVYKCTDCGAWAAPMLDGAKVIGVRVGSIVEGSEAEIGPIGLRFPFSHERWDDTIKRIEEQAAEAWRQANEED